MNANQIFIEQISPFDVATTVEKLLESAKKNEWQSVFVHNLWQAPNDLDKKQRPIQVVEIRRNEYSGYRLEKNHEKFLSIIMMPCRISV